MGLTFTMLGNDDQTLKTTRMEEVVPDEDSVVRSEGRSGDEPMDVGRLATPIIVYGPFKEFFDVWLAAYTTAYGPSETLPANTDSDGSSVPRLNKLALTRLRGIADIGSLCSFGRHYTEMEFSCGLSVTDQLLSVQRYLELRRIADGEELPYYPDEPPVRGCTSSDAKKMTRLERASERQKMNSGRGSASHVTRNRLVQRFLIHSRHQTKR